MGPRKKIKFRRVRSLNPYPNTTQLAGLCRIKLHFIPSYCPHLNPIERLWGLMHRNVTHNKCYATCAQFADATLGFLREQVPRNWAHFCDSVTDNFRVISPKNFRVMT